MTESRESARPLTRGDGYFLAIVVCATFLVRWLFWSAVHGAFWFKFPLVDSVNYHRWALEIQQGLLLGKDVLLHSPLYAFFLAGLYQLFGSQPATAAAIQLFLLAPLAGVLIYWLGRRLFSPGAGLAAGLLQAVYAPLFFFESTLLTTQLIHMINLLVLLAAYWALGRSKAWAWVVPGALIGLSVLARPNAVLLILVLAAWIAWRWRREQTWMRRLAAVAWLCVGAGALIAPLTVRNAVVLKEFLPTVANGGLNFYLGNFRGSTGFHVPQGEMGLSAIQQVQESRQRASEAAGRQLTYGQASRYWAGQGWREIGADPLRWLGLLALKTLRLFNAYEYTTSLNFAAVRERAAILRWPWLGFGLLAPLGLLGLILLRKQWLNLLPLYGLFAVYVFTNLGMLVSSEYRFALLPALLMTGGWVVTQAIAVIRKKTWRTLVLPAGLFAVLVIVSHLPVVPRPVRDYHLATAYANFGATSAQQGNFHQAADEFQRAIQKLQQQPAYLPFLSLQLGKAYLNAGQPTAALAPLEFAHARQPQDAETGSTLANTLTSLKQYQQALILRQQVVELAPTNPEYWVNLGITLLWMGQDLRAGEAFTRALTLAPGLAGRIEQTRQNILYYRSQ